MALTRWAGSIPPEVRRNHASAAVTAAVYFCSERAIAKQHQQSVVVLMLLLLITVSPQPPSAFWFRVSHSRPDSTSCSPASFKADTAVAVDRALSERRPSHQPLATRRSRSRDTRFPNVLS